MRLLSTNAFWAGACLFSAFYQAFYSTWVLAAASLACGVLSVCCFYLEHEASS